MKHLLLFIDSLVSGGAQRQLTGLAVLLKNKGYNVKVVTYHDYPFYQHILEENNVAFECMRTSPYKCLPRFIKIIKSFNTDAIISFQTSANAIACIAAFVTSTPLIVSERNTHNSISKREYIIFQLYRFAKYIVPNSFSEAKFICQHFKFLGDKVETIPNYVDLQSFVPAKKRVNSGLRKMLVVASIKRSKNTKRFIQSFIEAHKRGCKLRVKWYGLVPQQGEIPSDYMYAQECLQMVKDNDMEEYIELLPKRKDIQNAYQEADIFCLPSLFEGSPNAICEAMASGLPIIASDVCDNSRYVHEEENGFLFNPTEINSMSNTLLKIDSLADAELVTMGRNSRAIAERQCSKEDFVNKYIILIKRIVKIKEQQ